jgi:hypothetical protein
MVYAVGSVNSLPVGSASNTIHAAFEHTIDCGASAAQNQLGEINMARRNERHIAPNPAGGWYVQKPGSSRAGSHRDTQAQAMGRAREIVGNSGGGEVVIHGRTGRVRDSDTVAPGNDPNPPRDRR